MTAVKNRKQTIVLEWMWLRWMTSVRARMDMVEVGDERLPSNRHGGVVFKSPVRSGFLAPKQRNRTRTGPRNFPKAGNRQLDR